MDAAPDLKTAARQLVDRLPDGATWDDLMYEIYVRQAVEEGLADVDAGRTVSAEEARADLLAAHPAAGRAVPEYARPDIRELVEPPWRILYRYEEGAPAVYVLAVVHGRQQLPDRL